MTGDNLHARLGERDRIERAAQKREAKRERRRARRLVKPDADQRREAERRMYQEMLDRSRR
jgi:hypothetical protein